MMINKFFQISITVAILGMMVGSAATDQKPQAQENNEGLSGMEGKEKLPTQSKAKIGHPTSSITTCQKKDTCEQKAIKEFKVTTQPAEFMLEALVDFPDDALQAAEPITPQHIDAMMAALQRCGVRRVSWGYYGDGHGGQFIPAVKVSSYGHYDHWDNFITTYNRLGNPLRVAVEAAHRHGMELYAYYKPYETGAAVSLPEGSPEAATFGRLAQLGGRLCWQDRFVVDNPNLRIRRQTGDLPADIATIPIHAIKLYKKDNSPTRITKEHLQIWTSRLNYRYQKCDINFDFQDSIETAAKDIYDINDVLITKKGDPVRVLTLSGFRLTDPFIMVTTDFTQGPADFENTGTDIMVALDQNNKEIPGVFAPGSAIWMAELVDFRNWGLIFNHGYGRQRMSLDEPNGSGRRGIIGYTRGRNEYLPGALCETEPAVQAYWLKCIREMLDAGVDGIDFREENHSMHTDFPEEYGFNQVILDECSRRGGITPAMIAQVRGEAYTDFLRKSKKLIASYDKRMRINFQIDWYRENPPRCRRLAYPANLNFDWRIWISEGLLDQAMFRFYAMQFDEVFKDKIGNELIERCQKQNIPLTLTRYIHPESLEKEYRQVRDDGRFAGFVLYETATFTKFTSNGGCEITIDKIKTLKK
jgi:hypothetical protein